MILDIADQIPKPKSQNPNPKHVARLGFVGIWSLGFGIWDLLIEPRHLVRLDSPNQVFFHIVHAGRDADGNQRRALAGLDAAEVVAEAERARRST